MSSRKKQSCALVEPFEPRVLLSSNPFVEQAFSGSLPISIAASTAEYGSSESQSSSVTVTDAHSTSLNGADEHFDFFNYSLQGVTGQDIEGSSVIEDGGTTLRLTGNQ
ncbi:LEPR-XLL domain-containing protein, partial [Algisphaera agarilytica]|uniref:LEPR-XLL domain-containing protein n=1 Tax=Algisphaera agarilytica TaxID=1385975 RepID=UPI00160AC3B7